MSENAFKTVMEIDTLGTYNTVKATIEELKKTKGSVSSIQRHHYLEMIALQFRAAELMFASWN